MKHTALLLCLLFPSPALANDYTLAIAIELTRESAPQPAIDDALDVKVADPTEIDPPVVVRPAQPVQRFTTRTVTKYRTEERTQCSKDRWGRKTCRRVTVQVPYTVEESVPIAPRTTESIHVDNGTDTYATPPDVVERIFSVLTIRQNATLLDVGSGDGRLCIQAAQKYGCRAIGIEIDPERVALARRNAQAAGVSHLVTFDQRDYTRGDWPRADIVYVYQFGEDLAAIRDKLTRYDHVISYAHRVPGLSMASYGGGEWFAWRKPVTYAQPVAAKQGGIWYGGKFYTKDNLPHNGRCNCWPMCQTIKNELRMRGLL